MQHQLRLFFIALQFLTRCPVPRWVGYEPAWLQQCARWFPAVGTLVGLVAALVLWSALKLWPPAVAVGLSMAVSVWLTGGFHEDGWADTCDGLGGAVTTVDQSNAPIPYNSCWIGTCDRAGVPGVELLPPRTRCASVPRGLCDGAGNCVECLGSPDCPRGLLCAVATHTCGAGPCTDVDCGGVCAPCGLGFKCGSDADCASGACDAVTLRCVSDPCADHRRDRYETDVDCGGFDACPRCASGKACSADGDCELGHPCTPGRVCQ